MACEWFKIMLSLPRGETRGAQPTAQVARFHEVVGAVMYGLFGLVLLCAPALLHFILQVEYGGRAESYVRLLGVELVIVGFNYLVTGRAKSSRGSGQGRILASVPERLILGNILFLVLILTKALPLSLGLVVIIIESIFAVATLLIWYKTTHNATVDDAIKETFKPLTKGIAVKKKEPSIAVLTFGVIKFLIGFIFAVRPDFARLAFKLDAFKNNADGYLGAFFANVCRSAWNKIYMGKTGSLPFSIGNVFSHFVFKIPALVILVATKRIEVGIFAFVGALDLVFAAVVLILLCVRGLRQNSEDADEADPILPPKNRKGEEAAETNK